MDTPDWQGLATVDDPDEFLTEAFGDLLSDTVAALCCGYAREFYDPELAARFIALAQVLWRTEPDACRGFPRALPLTLDRVGRACHEILRERDPDYVIA
ncbi:MAG: hypothetical protein QNJ73_09335 [Gammaproteobacteria bacterium]|nr:hypothetical protein [Gammaproteobacteria bacterium]